MEIKEPEEVKLKYFSHLDKNQKARTINYLRIFKNNLQSLPYKEAVKKLHSDKDETKIIEQDLKAQKVFRDKHIKAYFPYNYKEIINKNREKMTGATYKAKNIIEQKEAREFDPEIQDTLMFTFEVKILVKKDDIENIFDDNFNVGDSDARVSNLFRGLYMLDQGLKPKTQKLT